MSTLICHIVERLKHFSRMRNKKLVQATKAGLQCFRLHFSSPCNVINFIKQKKQRVAETLNNNQSTPMDASYTPKKSICHMCMQRTCKYGIKCIRQGASV